MEESEDIQKKTFSKWINHKLAVKKVKKVTDLFTDLRDGFILISLLETLTSRRLKREKGSLKVHKLSNVTIVLNVLRENEVKLVNINNVDIVDGNPKITLALVWAIVYHWQFHVATGSNFMPNNVEKSLLAWCRQSTINYTPRHRDGHETDWGQDAFGGTF